MEELPVYPSCTRRRSRVISTLPRHNMVRATSRLRRRGAHAEGAPRLSFVHQKKEPREGAARTELRVFPLARPVDRRRKSRSDLGSRKAEGGKRSCASFRVASIQLGHVTPYTGTACIQTQLSTRFALASSPPVPGHALVLALALRASLRPLASEVPETDWEKRPTGVALRG